MSKSSNFRSFLQSTKNILLSNEFGNIRQNKLVLCVGNEAADADSIISALTYAYFRENESKILSDILQTRNFVPVVNVFRKSLHLRKDVDVLLSYMDVSLNDLICLDDVLKYDLSTLARNKQLGVILLDHNVLSMKLQNSIANDISTEEYMEEIIDHHKDQMLYNHITGEKRYITFNIETRTPTAGSTCTLVTEKMSMSPCGDHILKEIALLLKGVILLDTINMDSKAGKGTTRDLQMLNLLETKEVKVINRNELYGTLVNAKNDIGFWRSLSAEEALILDYKDFLMNNSSTVGVASVLLPMSELFDKDDAITYLHDVLLGTSPARDMYILMSLLCGDSNTVRREIAIVSLNIDLMKTFAAYIQDDHWNMNLSSSMDKLSPMTCNMFSNKCLYVQAFNQGNIKISRKQVAVMLEQFYARDV